MPGLGPKPSGGPAVSKGVVAPDQPPLLTLPVVNLDVAVFVLAGTDGHLALGVGNEGPVGGRAVRHAAHGLRLEVQEVGLGKSVRGSGDEHVFRVVRQDVDQTTEPDPFGMASFGVDGHQFQGEAHDVEGEGLAHGRHQQQIVGCPVDAGNLALRAQREVDLHLPLGERDDLERGFVALADAGGQVVAGGRDRHRRDFSPVGEERDRRRFGLGGCCPSCDEDQRGDRPDGRRGVPSSARCTTGHRT